MTAIEVIGKQREELKKAHNARFTFNGNEYRIIYEGGIGEAFGVYRRKIGTKPFKYVVCFSGYKMYSKEQVIAMAKNMVKKDV